MSDINVGDVVARMRMDMTDAERKLAGFNTTLKATADHARDQFGEVSAAVDRVSNGMLALSAAGFGVIGMTVKLAATNEQTELAFTSLLGSAEKAQAFLDDMRTFAASSPFEFTDLTNAARRMLALGFSAEQIKPMLTAVGDAVAAMGGGKEMIDGVVLALGQMQAKGKVSAQEMNQLAERGIPAWEMLAKSMGISIPEAMKKSEQGAIDSTTAINAIVTGMQDKFGGMMDKQAKTTAGRWSNLVDTLTQLAVKFGDAYLPLVNDLIDAAVKFAGALGKVNPKLLLWGTLILGGAGALGKLLVFAGQVRMAIEALTAKKVLDTLATKANTAAELENARAKLGTAGAAGTAGLGRAAGGVGQAAGGLAGLAGRALPVVTRFGPWAIAAAALAGLGYEIYKIYDYSKQAKDGMKEYNEELKKQRPIFEAMYKTARDHRNEAVAAGYTSQKDLINQAKAGNQQAMEMYARWYPKSDIAQRVGGMKDEKREVSAESTLALTTYKAERETIENDLHLLKQQLAAAETQEEKRNIYQAYQEKALALNQHYEQWLIIAEKQTALDAAANITDEEAAKKAKKNAEDTFNLKKAALDQYHARQRANMQFELEHARKLAEEQRRQMEIRLSQWVEEERHLDTLAGMEDALAQQQRELATVADTVGQVRLQWALRVKAQEIANEREIGQERLRWMKLIDAEKDSLRKKQLEVERDVALLGMARAGSRRIAGLQSQGDDQIQQAERLQKYFDTQNSKRIAAAETETDLARIRGEIDSARQVMARTTDITQRRQLQATIDNAQAELDGIASANAVREAFATRMEKLDEGSEAYKIMAAELAIALQAENRVLDSDKRRIADTLAADLYRIGQTQQAAEAALEAQYALEDNLRTRGRLQEDLNWRLTSGRVSAFADLWGGVYGEQVRGQQAMADAMRDYARAWEDASDAANKERQQAEKELAGNDPALQQRYETITNNLNKALAQAFAQYQTVKIDVELSLEKASREAFKNRILGIWEKNVLSDPRVMTGYRRGLRDNVSSMPGVIQNDPSLQRLRSILSPSPSLTLAGMPGGGSIAIPTPTAAMPPMRSSEPVVVQLQLGPDVEARVIKNASDAVLVQVDKAVRGVN